METVPNRENPLSAGKGVLLVSAPRNQTRASCLRLETVLRREAETYGCGLEVGPPSNVTIRAKVITNPGRCSAAAVGLAVPRWQRGD
jgi:hypothetical protein